MTNTLIYTNSIQNQDQLLRTLNKNIDEVIFIEHDFPIVNQPFDSFIRTLLAQLLENHLTHVVFAIERAKLESDPLIQWITHEQIQEKVKLLDYVRLPASESMKNWTDVSNLENSLEKSISLLENHPLLPKNVNYEGKIL